MLLRLATLASSGSLLLALGLTHPAVALPSGLPPHAATAAAAAPLSPAERGELTRQLVLKWGPYVQRIYQVPMDVWARRMVPGLVHADPANFRAALQRDTYEGAMAELAGAGGSRPDEAVIEMLAQLADGGGTQALGDLERDLVFVPITPCRILDTRIAGGAIPADSIRSFIAINAQEFTGQGGSPTNCGTLGLSAAAVAVNLTAVSPSAAGYATAYPYNVFDQTPPLAASINYTAGAIVNNALIIKIRNPLMFYDFDIYTFAQSHFVADIVGYFAPPVATALQCVNTAENSTTAAAGATFNVSAPACPTGYSPIDTQCRGNNADVSLAFIASGFCSGRNNSAGSTNVTASRTCCRVPGR